MKLKSDLGEDITLDMSPMIDMVFLLLIFFLVAATVVEVQKIPVDLPQAVYAKVPEDVTGRVIISINKNGELFAGSQQVSIDQLQELLRTEIDVNPKLRVMIRADGDVKYKINEDVMAACADVGAVDLIYSAFEKGEFVQ